MKVPITPPHLPTNFTSTYPSSSASKQKSTAGSHLLHWIVPLVALLVAATVGLVISNHKSAGASGWTDRGVQVVGSPVDVDGVAVLLNVDSSHELELTGIRPSTGVILWSHPYSASLITPGVAFTPVAIGNTVMLSTPAEGPTNPVVTLEGINAMTGKVSWKVSQPLVLSDAPVVCAGGDYFCVPTFVSQTQTDLVALNPGSGAVAGAISGPFRNMAVAPPGSENAGDLWQTAARAPTFAQTSTSGHLLWTQSVTSLFGSNRYNPNYGWDFLVTDNLDVGSVGVAPVGKTDPLDGFKTLGISTSTGTVDWSAPGYFLCGGGLQFLTSDLVCRYTGAARESGQSETMAGVGLTLQGLDPASGATTWSKRVLNAQGLSMGTNVAFADGNHLVVQLVGGQRVVLDVLTGTTAAPSPGEVFWCEQVPTYRVITAPAASFSGKRVGEPVYRSCSSTGSAVSGTPTTTPSTVGVTMNGMFIWPTPHGLRAEPSPE